MFAVFDVHHAVGFSCYVYSILSVCFCVDKDSFPSLLKLIPCMYLSYTCLINDNGLSCITIKCGEFISTPKYTPTEVWTVCTDGFKRDERIKVSILIPSTGTLWYLDIHATQLSLLYFASKYNVLLLME